MKRTLLIIGAVVAAVILLYVAHAAYVLKTTDGKALDAESKIWVDEIAPKILKSWDAEEIIKNASPEWLAEVPNEETAKFADWARETVGTMTKYGTSTGESGIHINNFSSKITAEYVVEADFTKGHARVFIQGLKKDAGWKIFVLHVDTNPNLRWFNGVLTDQPPLENAGDSQAINGVHYQKLWKW